MNRASAPGYDLFKLIVTIVLVLILILMLLRGCATTPTTPIPAGNEPAPTQSSGPLVETEVSLPTEIMEPATFSILPSATPTAVAAGVTPTSEPVTPTTEPATVTPEPTAAEPTATAATPSGDTTSCNTSVPSRLSTGQTARVVQRLNMRKAASITAPILRTNSINTQVEIIGGPVCTPVGESAYLWWQIRLANGDEGWSAESPLNESNYLLEPVP